MMRITLILLFLFASSASAHECSIAEAQSAENSIDSLDSWQSIQSAYKRYGRCDDGAIAEGFTDKVVHLLATRWSSLGQAQKIIARDPAFKTFMLQHINPSALSSELDHVAHLATYQCPRSAAILCKQIARAASER